MIDLTSLFLEKALESLAGAETEFANARHNNCANRCYYAAFQVAIAALIRAGIQPAGGGSEWGHSFVAAQFDTLINRRKLYPSEHRGILVRNRDLRRRADYTGDSVTHTEANRALRRTRILVAAVRTGGGGVR
jgi:uncharacterized protein (UPF0332 family)